MQFTNVKFFIPRSTINTMPIIAGEQQRFYEIDANDEILINKQYTEQRFWPYLKNRYEENKSGFQNNPMLPPTLTYDNICCEIKYDDVETAYTEFIYHIRSCMHIGQRKLFVSEFQFLANKMQDLSQKAIIIYAGAAPSCKIWFLSQLFPNVKFVLVDPNEFWIYWGEYDKPHYTAADTGEVVYLSYSNADKYNSRNFAWSRKHIKYYNPNTKKIVDILDKELNQSSTQVKHKKFKRDVKTTRIFKNYTYAQQESIDYILNSDHKIYLLEEFFTSQLATKFANGLNNANMPIYFWTDIRSNTSSEEFPSDLDIIWNNAMTYSWLRIMKDILTSTMLKFRVPFFTGEPIEYDIYDAFFNEAKELGCDFIEGTKDLVSMPYLRGLSYLQAWGSKTTTEQRLIIDSEAILANDIVIWNAKTFENKCFYYNCIDRYLFHENSNANKELGFDHCNDCSIENETWCKYSNKFCAGNYDIIAGIKKVTALLNVKIKGRRGFKGHGNLYPDIDFDNLQN